MYESCASEQILVDKWHLIVRELREWTEEAAVNWWCQCGSVGVNLNRGRCREIDWN